MLFYVFLSFFLKRAWDGIGPTIAYKEEELKEGRKGR